MIEQFIWRVYFIIKYEFRIDIINKCCDVLEVNMFIMIWIWIWEWANQTNLKVFAI